MTPQATAPDPLDRAFTAAWLTAQTFQPVEYVVPGIIPEGLTILAAAPKIGKSWMALGIAVAAATGSRAYGSIRVQQRPVLYLALEDGPRRLQSRLRAIGVEDGPSGLVLMVTIDRPVDETIAAFMDRHNGHNPLVIIDTLGKVRDVYNGNDSYQHDYAQGNALKAITDRHPGSSIIVVHHTRKTFAEDFVGTVSGTQGLTGSADTILVVSRDRGEIDATLAVTSRDAAEGTYALQFAPEFGTWSLNGATLEEAAANAAQVRSTQGVGDAMTQLVEKVAQYPEGTRVADLVEMLGWPRSKVDTYIGRAYDAGRIRRISRGVYGPVRSEGSVRFPDMDDLNL